MANGRKSGSEPTRPKHKPATTPEAREQQLVSLSVDEAERLIKEHKAPAQVLTHYLKIGSTREKLEMERLRRENELLTAKVEQLGSQREVVQLYQEAMVAFKVYKGDAPLEELDE